MAPSPSPEFGNAWQLQEFKQRAPAFDPATAQRRFRICMTDASHITLLPPLLERVRALAPGVRLEAARIDGLDDARDMVALEARIPLPSGPRRIGLSTVIEATDGAISYWALAHPSDKPDFHHPDSFVLDIP